MKILFSPVGSRDPICNNYDGSMLHICRNYKPDVVYLYLSKSMYNFHQKDNRYCRVIEKLGDLLNHNFVTKIIAKKDLEEVQEYDFFYYDFVSELQKIRSTMDEYDVLLVNMASGTPAMKSALMVIANVIDIKIIPIQVMCPKKNNFLHCEQNEDWDILWKNNNDNLGITKNRCKEVKCLNLVFLIKIDMIKKLVSIYDYKGAFKLCEGIEEQLPKQLFDYLKSDSKNEKINKEINKLLSDLSLKGM